METIRFYSTSEQYAWLSNFYPHPIELDGKAWPTVEHYFQAAKTFDEIEKEHVRTRVSPTKAKAAGRKVTLRPDWQVVKESFMAKALAVKFQNPELRERLKATGEKILVEASARDYHWGIGAKGTGKNRLGVLLMQLRATL